MIDFQELLGEHTGENIAKAVWESLGVFGLQKKVHNCAYNSLFDTKLALLLTLKAWVYMTDNASNMSTFVDGVESRAKAIGVAFNAHWARLRCMPHTIHLAALKVRFECLFLRHALVDALRQLLEGIGVVSKKRGQKERSPGVNYQDSVNTSLTEEADNHAAAHEGEEGGDDGDEESHQSASTSILPAVDKVCHFLYYLQF